jgi:hypothetical protein
VGKPGKGSRGGGGGMPSPGEKAAPGPGNASMRVMLDGDLVSRKSCGVGSIVGIQLAHAPSLPSDSCGRWLDSRHTAYTF